MPHTQPPHPGRLNETPPYSLVTLGTAGAGGAAATGTAPLTPLLRVEALGTGLAPQPRVAVEAGALPRRPVAFGCTGTPHGAAVAQVSCKEKEKMKPVCWGQRCPARPPTGSELLSAQLPSLCLPQVGNIVAVRMVFALKC